MRTDTQKAKPLQLDIAKASDFKTQNSKFEDETS